MNTHFKRHPFAAGASAVMIATALLASGATAQQVSSADPQAVKAGSYGVEPNHTQVGFSLSHFGFSQFSGFFSGASGTLQIEPGKVGLTKLNVSVPVGTVLTTAPVLDTELKGAPWFDSAKFPTATFTSTQVTATGKGTATVVGNLTLHGVTRPVSLDVKFIGAGVNPLDKSYTAGFEATTTIKRSEFGISTYVPLVGDAVDLKIDGAFVLRP